MTTVTATAVYALRTENEGITEVSLYATRELAEAAAFRLLADWYDHRVAMLGGGMVWAVEQTDRLPDLQRDATELLPIRKAMNARDCDAALELYNAYNPDDYSAHVERLEVEQ